MKKKLRTLAITLSLTLGLASNINAQSANHQQKSSNKPAANVTGAAPSATVAGVTAGVTGSGTAGQVARWTGNNSTSYVIGDSIITEDKFGKIGIGTTTPTSKLTVGGVVETTSGGFKFPDGTMQSTAGLSSVFHDATLAGTGTSVSPLGIATGGVGSNQLANNAVTSLKIATSAVGTPQLADNAVMSSKIAAGAVMTANLANSSVTDGKIASGQVVKSINGLTDNLTFAAGSNITITPVGNTLTIAAAAGGASPATSAFQGRIQGNWADGAGIANGTLTIPAGKRLVVEFITVTASLVLGQTIVDSFLNSTLDGNLIQHRIAVNSNPSFPTSPFTHVIDKPVRIYADALGATIARSPASGGADFEIIVSGYLVDLP